ncbi:MAG: LamG-like jellyroll fold domain-containing protein [Phycisphaerales bacterium]
MQKPSIRLFTRERGGIRWLAVLLLACGGFATPALAGPTACTLDVDGDGAIGFGDIVGVLAGWGPVDDCKAGNPADVDGNCTVSFDDLIAVLSGVGNVVGTNGACCLPGELDCLGRCFGTAVTDANGICCETANLDACGLCFGDGSSCCTDCPDGCSNQGTCLCTVCDCFAAFYGEMCECEGESLILNGLFQYVVVEYDPSFSIDQPGGSALTVEAWVKPTSFGRPVIAHLLNSGGTQWELSLGTTPADPFPVVQSIGAVSNLLRSNVSISTGIWNHVAFSIDAASDTAAIYINGQPAGVGPFDAADDIEGPVQIGSVGSRYFGGNIDDLRVWSVVRTPAEILASYNGGVDPIEPDLELYCRWDEAEPAPGIGWDLSKNNLDLNFLFFATTEADIPDTLDPPFPGEIVNGLACSGAGTPICGVCDCFDPADLTIDCSGGGGLDSGAIDAWRELVDLNGDGVVDAIDIRILMKSWGPCLGCPADFNEDGVVDDWDLDRLMAVADLIAATAD